jgi:sporulation protein YlmC with PRC-barrel domain
VKDIIVWRDEKLNMKFNELVNQDVFVDNQIIAKVKDLVVDTDEWKVTHLVVELTKQAAEEVLGATPALTKTVLNTLAISALEKGAACCTPTGIDLKISKGQLHIYLRPA